MHLLHIEGLDQVHPLQIPQIPPGTFLHHGTQVDGIDHLNIVVFLHDLTDSGQNVLHGLSVVLPAVAGQGNDPLAEVHGVQLRVGKNEIRSDGGLHGVDNGVAGDEDLPLNGFLPQIPGIGDRGREVQPGDIAHQGAVHLLGEGRIHVVGAKTGLHMSHRDLVIKGSKGAGKGGGGIAMNQNQIRLCLLQHPVHAKDGLGGDGGKGLLLFHDVQVILGLQLEDLHDGVEHLPVLTGQAAHTHKFGTLCKLQHQRGHLDGLGPGTEHGQDSDLIHFSAPRLSCHSDGVCGGGRR